MLAGNTELRTGRIVAPETFGTTSATLVRRDHHALSDRDILDRRTDARDFADDLAAADVRHGNLKRQTLADPQIEMVEAAGPHADQHVAGARLGNRELKWFQDVDPAGAGECDCFHDGGWHGDVVRWCGRNRKRARSAHSLTEGRWLQEDLRSFRRRPGHRASATATSPKSGNGKRPERRKSAGRSRPPAIRARQVPSRPGSPRRSKAARTGQWLWRRWIGCDLPYYRNCTPVRPHSPHRIVILPASADFWYKTGSHQFPKHHTRSSVMDDAIRRRFWNRLPAAGMVLPVFLALLAHIAGPKPGPVAAAPPKPALAFHQYLVDLGNVTASEDVVAHFDFTNRGSNEVEITELVASCGCLQ